MSDMPLVPASGTPQRPSLGQAQALTPTLSRLAGEAGRVAAGEGAFYRLLNSGVGLTAGAPKSPVVGPNMDEGRLRRAAEDFEAFFLSQALRPMFANLDAEEPFGGGFAEGMWRSMQVDEYGKAVAKAGGIGLADAIVREFLRMQENPEHPKP